MNDDILDYLIATDNLDEFLGIKDEYRDIDKEIKDTEEYISRLEHNGIYTKFQKEDLEYNKKLLEELKKKAKEH